MWRRIWILITVLVAALTTPYAQAQNHLKADSVKLVHGGDSVQLLMLLDCDEKQIGKDEVLLVEPLLVAHTDSATLPSVSVYGRNTYYYQAREGARLLQVPGGIKLRAKKLQRPLVYATRLAYEPWMDQADVRLRVTTERLCQGVTEQVEQRVMEAHPSLITTPDTLHREQGMVEGTAYIDYMVNRTEILSDYHRNKAELEKIHSTIDSVCSNPTAMINQFTIKGFASPEGPYDNNARLAKGRSESLRQYIIDHFGIDEDCISSNYEPEDWEGLRTRVQAAALPHREGIIKIIDSDEPDLDKKLLRIQQEYPEDYRQIIEQIMPYLRHSDYRIDYSYFKEFTVEGQHDTLWALPTAEQLLPDSPQGFVPHQLDFALKTNLLFDVAAAFNFEVEVPFGKSRRWSVMVEDWFPWYVWHHNSRAYEVWTVGAELRKWFGRCQQKRPLLTGTFAGLYAAGGKYDVEWDSRGYQGEFASFGLTIGHSWVLSKHWNLEASLSAGVVFGPQRHYHGEFNDTHLIWQYNDDLFYAGPTKAKVSLVWLLENPFKKGQHKKALFDKKKGGAR